MHDDTLKRTTNVKQVFPGRENERAETFTLSEVRQLNAGSWFTSQDPFGTIAAGKVTPTQVQAYQNQVVPTLADELEIVRQKGLVFIFDLEQPPDGHPFNQAFFDIVFEQIKQAGIDSQVWYLVNPEQLREIQAAAPQMVPTYGANYQTPPAIADLNSNGYRIVNVEYGLPASWIRAYRSAGLWVNVYTIDEPWQFSRLWLLGVDSITTSNAGVMAGMQRPLLALPYESYLAIWAGAGLLGLIFLFSVGRMIKLLHVGDQAPAHLLR